MNTLAIVGVVTTLLVAAPTAAEGDRSGAAHDRTRTGSMRVLTDEDLHADKRPRVGDTVMLSDFARCYPRSAISTKSIKGKWWLRPYRAASGQTGHMLCVEERDRDSPQSAIALPLTYKVDLEGVYDIWVGTYRAIHYGGVDIKLTRDKAYGPIQPAFEDGVDGWPPAPEKLSRIIECFYTTADLTGQNFHLRQPRGTYNGVWWGFAQSHIAYIKLIRRDSADVAREVAEKTTQERKGVMIDRDGGSYFYEWGTNTIDCIIQQFEEFRYGNIESINWCVGAGTDIDVPHPLGTPRSSGHGGRLGDQRRYQVLKNFRDNGIDHLHVVVDRCREIGLKIFFSHRIGKRKNYGDTEERDLYRDFLLYLAENYDIDGLTIDFTRHPPFFTQPISQQQQFECINDYLRQLRSGLDRVGQAKGRHLDLNASFETGVFYRGFRTAESNGLDVQTWIDEGIVDCIMPEGRQVEKYIDMCRDKGVKCYPRRGAGMTFDGAAVNRNQTGDPTPADNYQDRPAEADYTSHEIAAGVLKWYDAGADGVFLFNYQYGHTPLRHLPYPQLMRKEVESGETFGRRVGEKIEWLK